MHRKATVDDVQEVIAIKRAAAALYAQVDLPLQVDEDRAVRHWAAAVESAETYVWEIDGRVTAYLVLTEVDGALHIEQVSVHPDFAGKRIGAQLIQFADQLARERGAGWLTLTTFESVPWNAPYYTRLGFVVVPESEWTPGIAELMRTEALGYPPERKRVAMKRRVEREG
ncbi:GNAT family N-acetyltransferase [Leifsonia sp. 2TAF2]|uniref:GNAT family N-acetyltransferase n=1 Tax=Leifsonia sp. 2TAF2 TaxID=3233009 RepID=UPI003F957EEB